jgi:hypothetical protein
MYINLYFFFIISHVLSPLACQGSEFVLKLLILDVDSAPDKASVDTRQHSGFLRCNSDVQTECVLDGGHRDCPVYTLPSPVGVTIV